MTALNKQALREAAQEEIMLRSVSYTSNAWQNEASPEAVLALLGELEAAEKRIAELEAREVILPPGAPENLAACLDGYDRWVIATTFRDTWNACLSEVMRMNAAGIGVKGD